MEGSQYYGDSKYLTSIVQKQDRSKVYQVQQSNTPLFFKKKQMTQEQQRQLIQKKIYQNPSLFISTHVKCQVCNRYIQIQFADKHSKIHFEQQQRIQQILENAKTWKQ